MLLSPLNISPLSIRRTSGGVYTDATALHEWHYLNATEVGTTVTYIDTGSVGGLDLANPDAASKPTIGINGITYDGIINSVVRSVANFRAADNTGEFVSVFRSLGGTTIYDFVVQNDAELIEHMANTILSNTYRVNINTLVSGDRRSFRGSTDISSTSSFFTVTWGCTGSLYYIIVTGNNETITMVSGVNDGASWMSDFATNLISIGGLYRTGASDVFSNIEHKYTEYRNYTSIAESISHNIEVNNNVNI